MRKHFLSIILLPFFAALPFTLHAAQDSISKSTEVTVLNAAEIQASAVASRVDLNNANALVLQQHLSGIGKTKAEAIVAYREENGPFESVDELLEIKGIGEALLRRNKDKLVVR